MLTPNAKHIRRTTWTLYGLEAGAVLFVAGLVCFFTSIRFGISMTADSSIGACAGGTLLVKCSSLPAS